MNGGRPGVAMNGALFALLVYTYDAASEESPRGRERLEVVRRAMLNKGIDIADRDDPKVRELIALATAMLTQTKASVTTEAPPENIPDADS